MIITVYNLTVLATELNGRSTPNSDTPENINFPRGFKKGDVLESVAMSTSNGMTWYQIRKCTRSGQIIVLPPPTVWAGAGTTGGYLKLDSTVQEDDGTIPDPVEAKPIFVTGGIGTDGKLYVQVTDPNNLSVASVLINGTEYVV